MLTFRGRFIFTQFIILAGLSLFVACNKPAPPPLKPKRSPQEARAHAWADSVLARLTQTQKAAQLVFLDADLRKDSIAQAQFADSLDLYGFGGVILSKGQRDTLRRNVLHWKQTCELPVWVAFDAGPAWSEDQNWPSLLTLGTVASDSIAHAWGQALAAESQFLGAQICMISAGKVGEKGAWMHDALSVVPSIVTRLSDTLLAGIQSTGVQPCMRPLIETRDLPRDSLHPHPKVQDDLKTMGQGKAWPVQRLLMRHQGAWVQASDAIFAAVDTLPMGNSHQAIDYFLRRQMEFDGMVLSHRGAGIRSLEAGADVVVAPENPLTVVREIIEKVDRGEWTQEWLDGKVRKQLLAKARMNLDLGQKALSSGRPFTPASPDSTQIAHSAATSASTFTIDPYRRLLQLDRAMAKSTFVVLRDTKGRLPLGAGITQARVASMAIGSPAKTDLQVALDAYCQVDHYLLGTRNDSLSLARQADRLKQYDYVILSLHAPLVKDSASGRLPRPLVQFLQRMDRSNRTVVVDFAGQASLQDLATLSCLAFVSEDRPRTAHLAGQAIMGAFPVTTLLPDDISATFPAGSGKVLPHKLRWEYTEPEDLGVDPHAIFRIDSFVENAVRLGVFPGCQVFAAKDGKVFLHRGYGYHDYTRSQRVRNSDLYDIASVSKIAATTLMAMAAFDADTLKLSEPLKHFIRELDSSFITIKDITPQQLLTHSSGLPAGVVLNSYFRLISAPDSIRKRIYSTEPDSTHHLRIADHLYLADTYQDTVWHKVRRMRLGPQEYVYSDLSMYLMKAVLERILAAPLERYVDSIFYRPMGLQRICYHPLDRYERTEIVPTEEDRFWRRQVLQGDVHDPTVAFLGGIGGPAGIFSNSVDLATVMQMVLNGGSYGGRQYLKPETVALFTSRQPGSRRGLGFDMQLPVPQCDKGYCCVTADPGTFGHFGYTGTCAWADPKNKLVYVFLSNRVYPTDDNKKINAYRIRQGVQQLIYEALGLGLPPSEGIMAQEQDCYPEGA
jgi:beta-N-acetylhexosaminidase